MEQFKFAVMVTETTQRLKEITVEAADLETARDMMRDAERRFDKEWKRDRWHFIVGERDEGLVDDWKRGQFTEEECAALFPEDGYERDPCLTEMYRTDVAERLTPEQAAADAAAYQAWLDDPVAQARVQALIGHLGGLSDGADGGGEPFALDGYD